MWYLSRRLGLETHQRLVSVSAICVSHTQDVILPKLVWIKGTEYCTDFLSLSEQGVYAWSRPHVIVTSYKLILCIITTTIIIIIIIKGRENKVTTAIIITCRPRPILTSRWRLVTHKCLVLVSGFNVSCPFLLIRGAMLCWHRDAARLTVYMDGRELRIDYANSALSVSGRFRGNNNNNNNIHICIAPYGRNFRGAGSLDTIARCLSGTRRCPVLKYDTRWSINWWVDRSISIFVKRWDSGRRHSKWRRAAIIVVDAWEFDSEFIVTLAFTRPKSGREVGTLNWTQEHNSVWDGPHRRLRATPARDWPVPLSYHRPACRRARELEPQAIAQASVRRAWGLSRSRQFCAVFRIFTH